MAHEPESFGPVERELVRMLRSLELTELQPGVRERCWKEFCELANLPDSPPPPASAGQAADQPEPAAEPGMPARSARVGGSTAAAAPAKFKLRARPA